MCHAQERAYADPDVAVVLLAFFDLTVGAVRDVRDFAIDGTGLSTSIKDNWGLLGRRISSPSSVDMRFLRSLCVRVRLARGMVWSQPSGFWILCMGMSPLI